jgi:hypothetical protein
MIAAAFTPSTEDGLAYASGARSSAPTTIEIYPNIILVARTATGQDGLNSFSDFLADTRSDLHRAKSREFSVTSRR